jgi:hypothetical protein
MLVVMPSKVLRALRKSRTRATSLIAASRLVRRVCGVIKNILGGGKRGGVGPAVAVVVAAGTEVVVKGERFA